MIGFNKDDDDVGDVSPVLDERMRHSQVPLKVPTISLYFTLLYLIKESAAASKVPINKIFL